MTSFCKSLESHYNVCIAFKNVVCKYFIKKDVYFRFRFFYSTMFTNNATPFLKTGDTEKYLSVVKDF